MLHVKFTDIPFLQYMWQNSKNLIEVMLDKIWKLVVASVNMLYWKTETVTKSFIYSYEEKERTKYRALRHPWFYRNGI